MLKHWENFGDLLEKENIPLQLLLEQVIACDP